MKRVKISTSDSYQDYLIESLKDPQSSAAYIEAILSAEDPENQLLASALKDVIDAQLRIDNFSDKAKENWGLLNKMLSQSGGAEIYKLVELLNALGFKLEVSLK